MTPISYAPSRYEEQELRQRIARLSYWHRRAMTAGQPERARCAEVAIKLARKQIQGARRCTS